MKPVSTALTWAWLDAFRRLAANRSLFEESRLPDGPSKTLTDAIEGALRGAAETPERMVKGETERRTLDIRV